MVMAGDLPSLGLIDSNRDIAELFSADQILRNIDEARTRLGYTQPIPIDASVARARIEWMVLSGFPVDQRARLRRFIDAANMRFYVLDDGRVAIDRTGFLSGVVEVVE